MPFTQAGGVRIAYDVRGDGDTVVFVHDRGATRAVWSSTLGALAPDYRAIALDLRGHGDSDAAPSPDHALVINAVLDAEQVARAHLVGAGLGAEAVLAFALAFPARARSVTLVDPTPDALGPLLDGLQAPYRDLSEPVGSAGFMQRLRAFLISVSD